MTSKSEIARNLAYMELTLRKCDLNIKECSKICDGLNGEEVVIPEGVSWPYSKHIGKKGVLAMCRVDLSGHKIIGMVKFYRPDGELEEYNEDSIYGVEINRDFFGVHRDPNLVKKSKYEIIADENNKV